MFVSVSTMPAKDVLSYAKQIESFADFLHCDICDGMYNNSKYFSPEILYKINQSTTLPLDCHLMTKNNLENAKVYLQNGANIVTCQIESFDTSSQIFEFIKMVHNGKALVGLSLEPETEVKQILPYLDSLDLVLIMSVKTGKSGKKFDESVLQKIEYLYNLKKSLNKKFLIEVDGGISDKNIALLNGMADIVVSGSYVYNASNKKEAIDALKKWPNLLVIFFKHYPKYSHNFFLSHNLNKGVNYDYLYKVTCIFISIT